MNKIANPSIMGATCLGVLLISNMALAGNKPDLPTIDISSQADRHVIVAAGTEEIYQGHPHTLLLPDGKTIFCIWTEIHGWGAPHMKRSDDGGKTWSEDLPLPEGWAPYGKDPTIHLIVGPDKKQRLLLSDRKPPPPGEKETPYVQAISEDMGKTWSKMKPNGLVGVVSPMSIIPVEGGKKHLLWTHRGIGGSLIKVWQAESTDGGLTWKNYHMVCAVRGRWEVPGLSPCEPAVVRSPDGKQLLCLMRENRFTMGAEAHNSLMMFSDDEGKSWSKAVITPWGLSGHRHCPKYAPDGRLVVPFRDRAPYSPTFGHFVAWVGTYEDIRNGRPGQYRIKLLHSHAGTDCGYPGLELLPDGTFVATTYIKYKPGPEKHSVVSVRFNLDELDQRVGRTVIEAPVIQAPPQ